jgi:hypothetical protein
MTIKLDPDLESRLRAEAAKHGLEASDYAAQLIEQNLPVGGTSSKSLWNTLTPEEWQREARAWVDSHDPTLPLLSDEAVSRESFYEGRPRWPT